MAATTIHIICANTEVYMHLCVLMYVCIYIYNLLLMAYYLLII